MRKEFNFTKPQLDFISSKVSTVAFCGGWGAGKTFINLHLAIQNRLRVPNSKYIVAFYEPSHSLLTSITYPTLNEILPMYGLEIDKNCTFVGNPKQLIIHGFGSINFYSLTDDTKITGFNAVSIHVDETDRINEKVMTNSFRQMGGRLREALTDSHLFKDMVRIAFTSTPEGFKFLYKNFDKTVIGNKFDGERKLIKASIYSNTFIDANKFINENLNHLPDELKRAYIYADFVNLQTGSVYKNFNREHHVIENISYNKDYEYFIGCDFNIQKMAGVICIKDEDDNIIVVDEIYDKYDTAELIEDIQNKPLDYRKCNIFPDASGANRHTAGSYSNIDLLRKAMFKQVKYDTSGNPRVMDTINLINSALINNKIKITKKCVKLITALEQQTYTDKGEPDKTTGIDHILDAFRYVTWFNLRKSTKLYLKYKYFGL